MGNHYPPLIETLDGDLSRGVRQLNGVYTQHFNRIHGRVGHGSHGSHIVTLYVISVLRHY